MCSIYSCRLEPLTSIRECKLTDFVFACFLTSRRSCVWIDILVCPNRLTRPWALTGEQQNIFFARFTLGTVANCQKLSYAHFDVCVALVQYLAAVICWFSMFWLERLLKCVFTYLKYRSDNLPYGWGEGLNTFCKCNTFTLPSVVFKSLHKSTTNTPATTRAHQKSSMHKMITRPKTA